VLFFRIRLDAVETLEREKEFYLDQIRRINVALSALKGEITQGVAIETKTIHKRKNKTSWKQEIVNLFHSYNELSKNEIQQKLVENGIVEAEGTKGKNAINTTLKRMIDKGGLVLTENGNYQKRKRVRGRIGLLDTNNESEKVAQPNNQ